MYKTRNPFLLFSAIAALLSLAGCPNNPNGVDCDANPTDPSCQVDCNADPLNVICGVNCQDFPTLFPECQDCSQHPDDSAFCDCANPILLTTDQCCEQDPEDPFCQTTNNPHPNGGGAGDSGCAPLGTEVCTNNNQDEGFDNDCNGVADDGCSCSSATEDQLSCYTGPAGTRNVGACSDGLALCEGVTLDGDETWGDCVGQTLPLPNDDCGDIDTPPSDTNCNGIIGDGCSALVATCPAEIFAAPLQTKTLTATAIPSGGTITSTVWTISQRPVGSTTGPSPANSLTTNVFLDVAGDFTLTFTAQDSFGASGQCSTIVHAIPTENLRIELSWNTDSADIDSHLLHPTATSWYSSLDCDYLNCKNQGASWPAAGTDDNPRLDIDDVNGFGPENINIDIPEVNTTNGYRFGAYNFSDHGDGPSDITVRIFCGGVVKAQLTHNDLAGPGTDDASSNQLWKVADIKFTSTTTCNVTPVDTIVLMGGAGVPR